MADLLSRGELMELDVDQLVEKILGLRGDIAEDAEEIADLRDELSDVEEARDEAQAECARLRRELAAAERLPDAMRAAVAAGNRLFDVTTGYGCGLVVCQPDDHGGAWLARLLILNHEIIDDIEGRGAELLDAVRDLATQVSACCVACVGTGEDQDAVEHAPCSACGGTGCA